MFSDIDYDLSINRFVLWFSKISLNFISYFISIELSDYREVSICADILSPSAFKRNKSQGTVLRRRTTT